MSRPDAEITFQCTLTPVNNEKVKQINEVELRERQVSNASALLQVFILYLFISFRIPSFKKIRSSKSLLANVLDIDDDFRCNHRCNTLPHNPTYYRTVYRQGDDGSIGPVGGKLSLSSSADAFTL